MHACTKMSARAKRVGSFTWLRSPLEYVNFRTEGWTIWIRDEFGTYKVILDRTSCTAREHKITHKRGIAWVVPGDSTAFLF